MTDLTCATTVVSDKADLILADLIKATTEWSETVVTISRLIQQNVDNSEIGHAGARHLGEALSKARDFSMSQVRTHLGMVAHVKSLMNT